MRCRAGPLLISAGRSIPFTLGAGATFATTLVAFRYANGFLGSAKTVDEEELERRDKERKMRRRPLHETLEQLGEGRGKLTRRFRPAISLTRLGILAPGHEERRRERLLARYGVDVKEAQEQLKTKSEDPTTAL